MTLDTFLLIFYLSIALLFSFICSIMEAVLLSITPQYIAYVQEKKQHAGKIMKALKTNINKPLTAILTLNTIAHTMGAVGVGAQVMKIYGSHYLTISSILLTLLVLFFSEIIPKTLGTHYWRQLALYITPLIYWLSTLFSPITFVTEKLTRKFVSSNGPPKFAREEFNAAKEIAKDEGTIQSEEYLILDNLLKLKDRAIYQIITPRTVTFTLSCHISVEQYFYQYDDQPFSRIPIYQKDKDNIIGFVMRRDILVAQARGNGKKKLIDYMRELLVIINKFSILKSLKSMLENKSHIAMVVDEQGVYLGIITLEDILEELIGAEIIDEHDRVIDMQKLAMHKKSK